MADTNATTPNAAIADGGEEPWRRSTRKSPTSRPRRASQRLPVRINLASQPLKALMVEQCHGDAGGFMTAYRGSAGELLAAGVPEGVLAPDGAERAFRIETINVCCTGDYEILDGITRRRKDRGGKDPLGGAPTLLNEATC